VSLSKAINALANLSKVSMTPRWMEAMQQKINSVEKTKHEYFKTYPLGRNQSPQNGFT
jgi:hypothetical protein